MLLSQAQGVSVLACTPPLAMVISYSSAHREECGPAPLPPKIMLAPTDTRGLGHCSNLLEAAKGLVLPFSHSPAAKYGIGAETSAPVSSVPAPKDKHDRVVSVTLSTPMNKGGSWLPQPTVLPGSFASPCFILLLCLLLLC